MARPKILAPYQRFIRSEQRNADFLVRSLGFHEVRGTSLKPLLTKDRYLIAEIAFLSLLLEWEVFIEEIFSRLLCLAHRRSPPQPRLIARFSKIDAAKQALRGRAGFVGWIQPSEIIRQSNLFFLNGEPFSTPIRAAYSKLEELRIIRNRVAHSSAKAQVSFNTLIRSKYGYSPREE